MRQFNLPINNSQQQYRFYNSQVKKISLQTMFLQLINSIKDKNLIIYIKIKSLNIFKRIIMNKNRSILHILMMKIKSKVMFTKVK